MNRTTRYTFIAVACMAIASTASSAVASPDFERDVAPILIKRCLECHESRNASGSLDLSSYSGLQKGGKHGNPIRVDEPDGSLLISRLRRGEMPPPRKGESQRLPDREIEVLRSWMRAGAQWPEGRTISLYERTSDVRAGRDWWSLRPVKRPDVPDVDASNRIANPIDAFVVSRLHGRKLSLAPPADQIALIRRVYFDVVGLPPSPREVREFLADDSPLAWERVIDRLLSSPAYGERWSRYWLDVARFAETSGYERDQTKPGAWKYRDWVVSAFNEDKRYDEFITEQLAGDEVESPNEDTVTATGFLRVGTWNDEPNDRNEYTYERLEDLVHATSSAFLGLTIKCARCHDHKFDPIRQRDYYRVAASFWTGPVFPYGGDGIGGPSHKELGFNVLGWTDVRKNPPPLKLLKAGDPKKPGDVVPPAHLSFLPALDREWKVASKSSRTSRRRIQLANWIADDKNPLAPRVLVNRLWQHHFGRGIVSTPNNFGFRGGTPTHPGLLEWLASEFVDNGFRIKPIQRAILLSETYRQSSLHPNAASYEQVDAGNHYWWHFPRRRLDAEALRDAMLEASGDLDRRLGGPSFRPYVPADALEGLSRKSGAWKTSPLNERRRRSLYIFSQRSLIYPLMTTFDFCDTTRPCGQRNVTNVAPQALALLNNSFVHERSAAFARRLSRESSDLGTQIDRAWQLAFGRSPRAREKQLAREHVEKQRTLLQPPDRFAPTLTSPGTKELVLHLRAEQVEVDEKSRVLRWRDASQSKHDAHQPAEDRRPVAARDTKGRRVIRFDGKRRFLELNGALLPQAEFSIFCVVRDDDGRGHREVISNWNRNGNSTTSIFLGLTDDAVVRLSDD
ncbi:MAG: PSD1 and planctomycete cytochrome C domain-containing protein, partial [Planctomycetota bacterium]